MMIYYLVVINIITFFSYILDKWFAIKNKRRISEFQLLLLSICGGCFLGFISMYLVHHKTRKFKFIIINIIAIIVWFFILLNIDINLI